MHRYQCAGHCPWLHFDEAVDELRRARAFASANAWMFKDLVYVQILLRDEFLTPLARYIFNVVTVNAGSV